MKSLIATAAVSACLVLPVSADLITPTARKAAPDFNLRDAKGASARLSSLKGRVVVLDFWATWCAGCKVEIPWFIEFHKTYGAQGLSPIGIAMDDEGWKIVTPYLKEHPISYPILAGDLKIANQYDVTSLPVTLLIDRNGRIAARHVGIVEKAAFEQEVRRLLDEKTPQK